MWLVMLPVRGLRWTWMQAVGTVRGLRSIAAKFSFDAILPSGVTGFIYEVLTKLAYAAGRGSKARGVFSGTTLVLLGILTSWTGIGLVLIAIGAVLLAFNLVRAVPAINDAWRGSAPRRAIRRDRDVPLFERE